MRIYSMTATFGKLEKQTLTLQPGLNIIEAPNEWGKSTWCAFLAAMLYGIETRTHTTKSALADKERYSPWSGSPMSGRMDICWNGRDITIERRTKGRLIFGDFRAYETATGIPVTELNGANCGQKLLGVEKSVFLRAGFLKLTDLPVTQDEALRRRLNALVTTGDESGTADRLDRSLRELKNRCRYNKSGLLPQAQAQREAAAQQLRQLDELQSQKEQLLGRQASLERYAAQLENHQTALQFAAARADADKVKQALRRRDEMALQLQQLTETCRKLPDRQTAARKASQLRTLREQWESVQMEQQMLPQSQEAPPVPAHYQGRTPEEALRQAQEDESVCQALEKSRRKWNLFVLIWGILGLLACGALLIARFVFSYEEPMAYLLGGGTVLVSGVAVLVASLIRASRFRRKMDVLYDRHPGLSPDKWVADAQKFAREQVLFRERQRSVNALRGDLDSRWADLAQQISDLCGAEGLQPQLRRWQQVTACHDALDNARREYRAAAANAEAMQSMAKQAKPPAFADTLTCSEAETLRLRSDTAHQLRQLQLQLGQCQGQMESLGSREQLHSQLRQLDERIGKLNETIEAITLAQQTLEEASAQLQRRFAPRISARAKQLLGILTDQRYDRLVIGQDFSLQAGSREEEILRSAQWRSDGTADQLYFALRLAVAESLTPHAPLVLDDALVRFDDRRLKAALDILQEMGETKQVILFTCQSREKEMIK